MHWWSQNNISTFHEKDWQQKLSSSLWSPPQCLWVLHICGNQFVLPGWVLLLLSLMDLLPLTEKVNRSAGLECLIRMYMPLHPVMKYMQSRSIYDGTKIKHKAVYQMTQDKQRMIITCSAFRTHLYIRWKIGDHFCKTCFLQMVIHPSEQYLVCGKI